MTDACDQCLRTSYLLAFLANDVQALVNKLPGRPRPAPPRAGSLLRAVSDERKAEATAFLAAFCPHDARADVDGHGLDALCHHAAAYPAELRQLDDPPAVLYLTSARRLGEALAEPAAVIVGTRRPSEYGRTVAYGLGRGLGASGVPVVSGLALGIDAVAHRGCLDGRGLPVAVLAGGPDQPYPRTNRGIYERIREVGTVLAELPPGRPPKRWIFPARNRIMAALGRVTVVVEAAEQSGTLITAGYAADLGRDVAAVPGWVTARMAAGTNGLLRNGAALVTDAQDVLDLLYGAGARELPPAPERRLDPVQRLILDLVGEGAGIDQLRERTGLEPQVLRSVLARLELAGRVQRRGAGAYVAVAHTLAR